MKEWIHLTSDEVDQLNRSLPVIIPLGLTEAHGPHLAVSVDTDAALYFSRRVADETGAILAPAVQYGFADEMAEYPGTLGVTATTYMAVITDICLALCKKGFMKIIFIAGHGANKIPCEMAFYKVWEQFPMFKGVCWNWWSDCGIRGIHHADKGETEVALALGTTAYMERVKDFKVQKPWYKIRSRYALDPRSGGINGNPSAADIETGKTMVEQAALALNMKVKEAISNY
ncbi:creatininase family protein [Chitinophaga sp. 22321]|uniref:Creatininase family protein n=1 Tax=Chitinophaga hostae TaxID=2831022 RepID=A0ABS5IXK1_9BACT|nr:creatininase family protein [Chitinophaga hostae]MBS0027689.1 creatininase family protein [Chitinophaga hostae]